ncbi:respiratory nitrate reductase subunit gamma [Staphylococcus aureus]
MGCYATLIELIYNIQILTTELHYQFGLEYYLMLKPDASLMSGVPIAFKMHILLGFTYYGFFVGDLHVWYMFGVYL